MVNINIQKKDLWLLSAIMIFLVGVAVVVAYGSGESTVHGHDAGEVEGVGFGDWTSTDNLGSTLIADTVYRADCDGFISFSANSAGIGTFIYTDNSNPPTIAVTGSDAINSNEAGNAPVKEDEYVRVLTNGGTFSGSIRWRPIGDCNLVKQ